jgi:hypothetical protein
MAAATLTERAAALVAQMGGLTILAATLAAVTAAVYRWYVRETVSGGLALLVGLSGVAVYLNTTTALGQVIAGSTAPTDAEQALFNIAAFCIAAGGAAAGKRVGDQFATDVLLGDSRTDVDGDVGRLVQSVGRVISVELPQDIDDVTGYDPIPAETAEKLAGRTFLFPKRLTLAELRERLIHRLKTDYAVGHVDVELADDGSIEYLALGSRAAGIGPTLPPATNAVAIRADPAFAASAGDLVQVWETTPMRRVLTAELRGVADETVTVAIDAADTPKLDPNEEYRLVTLPVTDRPDREFASLLRAADETFSSVTVEAGSPLHGLPVGALDLAVVAIEPEGEQPRTLPEPSDILAPGDIVFAIARPDALRRLERAAEPLDPALVSRPAPSKHPRDQPANDTAKTEGETMPETAGETDATADASAEPEADEEDKLSEEDAADEESPTRGQAGSESFRELKDEFDAGEAEWDETDESGEEERATADSDGATADADTSGDESEGVRGKADAGSFRELKDEFESGEAEWAGDDERPDDIETVETDPAKAAAEDDAPDDLDDADDGDLFGENAGLEDVTFDEDEEEDSDDSGLDDLEFDEDDADDDLAALGGVDDADDGFTLDETEDEDDEDDEDEDDEGDEADDDDDDSGGGGTSFAQLKEEFESGEADWEDDISDSPGGDMRLDE